MSEPSSINVSVADQFRATFVLVRRSIACFEDSQWAEGISGFEVPVLVAYHTLQCLLFYFRDDPETTYREIPPKFGKEWWEMERNEWPGKGELLDFLQEVETMAMGKILSMTPQDLAEPFPHFGTVLGNLLYALRHTMHHQGGLNVLSVHHGIDADLWDQE